MRKYAVVDCGAVAEHLKWMEENESPYAMLLSKEELFVYSKLELYLLRETDSFGKHSFFWGGFDEISETEDESPLVERWAFPQDVMILNWQRFMVDDCARIWVPIWDKRSMVSECTNPTGMGNNDWYCAIDWWKDQEHDWEKRTFHQSCPSREGHELVITKDSWDCIHEASYNHNGRIIRLRRRVMPTKDGWLARGRFIAEESPLDKPDNWKDYLAGFLQSAGFNP